MQLSLVTLSALGLLLTGVSFAQTADAPPVIDFFDGDIHRDLSGGAQVSPPVIRSSPEFVIRLADGKQATLSSFRGRVVALVFIHTTCPICQEASRVFTKLYAEYGSRGFQPLDVAFNSKADAYLPEFIKKFGISYLTGFSSCEEVMGYLGLPATERFTIPQIVWVDRNGDIRSQTAARGGDAVLTETYWRGMIETLLNEAGRP